MARTRDDEVKFSWSQFWISFLYENLPPVFVSPFAVLMVERSWKRTWNICHNRGLFAISTKAVSPSMLRRMWFMIFPGSWLITIGLLIALFADPADLPNIDTIQVVLAYSMLVVRRLIIATKYGFFSEQDFEALAEDAPYWDFDKTQRRLIFQGWARPRDFPGLLDTEMRNAKTQTGLAIDEMTVETGGDKPAKLVDIVEAIVTDVYAETPANRVSQFVTLSTLLLLFAVVYSRVTGGNPIFGDNALEAIVSLAVFASILVATNIFGFALMCGFDFRRRQKLCELFQDALLPPGIQLDDSDGKSMTIFFDKHSPNCVDGWVQGRNVARAFGYRYFGRVQSYTSILIAYAGLCLGLLNIITWTQLAHHKSTIVMAGVMIVFITGTATYAMQRAIALQRASYLQRGSIQDELLSLEVEIAVLRRSGKDNDELESLLAAKALLQQVDENVNFEELVFRPTTILGNKADGTLIGSILSIIITGALLSLQGFASTGMGYDPMGWFR